jgi:flagellar M-ring protein FliF
MRAARIERPNEDGRGFVDGLTSGQKAMALLGVLAVVIASVTFMKWSSTLDHAANTAPDGTGANASGSVSGTGSTSQLAQAQAYDAELEQRIENMLSNTLGPGHAAVTVAAQLDNSKRSSVTTKYGEVRPDATVPITQNDAHETLAGGSGRTTPTTVYEKTQTQHRNAVDSTVTSSATPPGTLKRLSVSVLLDRAVVTPAAVASIWRPSIEAAAGIDPQRDGVNALKIMTVAFDKTARKRLQAAQSAGPARSHPVIALFERLLALLMLAVVLLFAWRAIKSGNNRALRRDALDLLALESTRAQPPGHHDATTAGPGSVAVRASIDEHSEIEAEIADLIERQPDEVAQTLRSWLADRRT